MSKIPRLLPLVAVAIGGVLAVKAISAAPQLLSGAQAFAEGAAAPGKTAAPMPSLLSPASAIPAHAAAPACAPTAAELAKEAGLSPAELQVLQSLGDRRGQLDQRASELDIQVQLMAAAQAKLDARIQQMNGLKSDIQALLGQADQQQQAETDSLVRVYEAMKPKDAAARITLMDDSVRLPMAAKMKERALSAILAMMSPEDAKSLTEKLAKRVLGAAAITGAQAALNPPQTPATPPAAAPAASADASAPAAAPTAVAAAKPVAKPRRHAAAKPKPAVRTARAAAPATPAAASATPGAAAATAPKTG
jgi:flagellar motility protein MotE (MotC chaperone)